MKFIIIPKELFDSIPEEAKKQLGIDNPRMNIDETEVLLHIEHYDVLFPSSFLRSVSTFFLQSLFICCSS